MSQAVVKTNKEDKISKVSHIGAVVDPSEKSTINADSGSNGCSNMVDNLVQYIVVRTDLKWTTGATIAQACHASTASITKTSSTQTTKDYLADLENMHKIILQVDSLDDLKACEIKLNESKIPHHMWIERPEGLITCLAVSPQPRSLVKSIFSHLKLLR